MHSIHSLIVAGSRDVNQKHYSKMKLLLYGVLSFSFVNTAVGSLGNSFPSYKLCCESCREDNCNPDGIYYKYPSKLPVLIRILWRCSDDCQYHCMWETVATFQRKGWQPPQFHGKWPFVRILGIQEPASVVFSLLNLAVHIKMYKRFVEEVRFSCPMYLVWSLYAIVCMNAWLWSAVFHSRDLPLTEMMDYLSAFAMVLYVLYGVGMRILLKTRRLYSVLFSIIVLLFFFNHAIYLTWDTFDYRYNMLANITAGAVSGVVSLLWSLYNWKRLPHSRLLTIVVVLCGLTTILELSDFPPFLWIFDAHALWHLVTVPIPYFFWRFVIDDCKYLRKTMYKWHCRVRMLKEQNCSHSKNTEHNTHIPLKVIVVLYKLLESCETHKFTEISSM